VILQNFLNPRPVLFGYLLKHFHHHLHLFGCYQLVSEFEFQQLTPVRVRRVIKVLPELSSNVSIFPCSMTLYKRAMAMPLS
jgi:hypothetical protein